MNWLGILDWASVVIGALMAALVLVVLLLIAIDKWVP